MKNLMIILMLLLSACADKKNTDAEKKKEKTFEEFANEWQQQNHHCAFIYDCITKQKMQFDIDSITVFALEEEEKKTFEYLKEGTKIGLPEGIYLKVSEKADEETANYLDRSGVAELTVFKSKEDELVCTSFEKLNSFCVINKKFLLSMHFKTKPTVGSLIEVGVSINTFINNKEYGKQ